MVKKPYVVESKSIKGGEEKRRGEMGRRKERKKERMERISQANPLQKSQPIALLSISRFILSTIILE